MSEQVNKANAKLEQRLRELDTLYHISKVVTSLQERTKLLERIVDAALYITVAMDGQIILLDPTYGDSHASALRRRPKHCGPSSTTTWQLPPTRSFVKTVPWTSLWATKL